MISRSQNRESVARWERRAFHLTFGLLFPILVLALPMGPVLFLAFLAVLVSLLLEVVRHYNATINQWFLNHFSALLKRSESSDWLGSTYLLIATLMVFLLFDRTPAALSLLFLAVGDPTAAIIGQRFGRTRFRKKSLEGSLAFFVVALSIGGLFISAGVDLRSSVVFAGALIAALVEFLDLPPDDNLTVPLASTAAMVALA